MFLNNKYTRWYFSIIENAKNTIRSKTDAYFERHHIVPKGMGGSNAKNNLVLLTAKEHFICHLLLTKMCEEKYKRNMCYALIMLQKGSNPNHQRYNSKLYGYFKPLIVEHTKEHRTLAAKMGGDRTRGKNYNEIHGQEKSVQLKKLRQEHGRTQNLSPEFKPDWNNPEWKERAVAGMQNKNPEKYRLAALRRWGDPIQRAKICNSMRGVKKTKCKDAEMGDQNS